MILKRTNSFELLKTLIWIMRKGQSPNQNQRPVQSNNFQRSRTCGAQYYSCQKQQKRKRKKEKVKLYLHSAMSRDYVKHFASASRPLKQQQQRTQHCNDSMSTKRGREGWWGLPVRLEYLLIFYPCRIFLVPCMFGMG